MDTCQTTVDELALDKFLTFLEQDMTTHAQQLQVLDATLIQRVNDLVGDVQVDLDQPLSQTPTVLNFGKATP
nr:type II toxin-antitoxin system PrlF family antitoxin [uncultured Limnohabitans sp.]